MEITAVLGFAAVAITLIAVPGPDWAFILAVGVRSRVVVPAVGGLVVGYALLTAVVAIGIGPLVAAVPGALLALTLFGAAYLSYLGGRTFRTANQTSYSAERLGAASSVSRDFLRGLGVSAINPKALLIFLSVLPQFTNPSWPWPMPAQLGMLGGIFVALIALAYLPLGYAAGKVLGARPSVARVTTRIAGVAMVLVGIALTTEFVVGALA